MLSDMCCYHPITIVDPHTHVAREVPCGKCIGCLQDYQNSWKIRISDELRYNDYKGVYFTLSYDPIAAVDTGNYDEFCKDTPFDIMHDRNRVLTVWKDDIVKWLKRCRRRMEYDKGDTTRFLYFITSEYGPQTLRPHYHGIFIGLDAEDFERYFLSDWSSKYRIKRYKRYKKGRYLWLDNETWYSYKKNKHYKGNVKYENIVYDGGKSPDACADYVSKYCSKGFFENPRVARGDVEPTFHLVSKGLGYSAIQDLKKDILKDYKECSVSLTDSQLNFCKYYDLGLINLKDYYYGLLSNYNPKVHDKYPITFESGIKHSYNTDGSIKGSWYETIYALMPTLSFMRELCERCFIVRYNPKKDKTYKYKLPRYYYEKLFPKDSAIRKAFSNVLQVLYDEKLSRELASLSASWPDETDTEIYHRYLVQKADKNSRAESEKIRFIRERYGKSIL